MADQALAQDTHADSYKNRGRNWWNKLTALIALANILLALFNLSYIPLRDVYVREFPKIATLYDPVKSIEPHPDTQRYLKTVDALTVQLSQQGRQAPPIEPVLQELRQQSNDLIEENPSLLSDLLEELKINYVQRSTDEDPEATLEEADQLRQEMETPPTQ